MDDCSRINRCPLYCHLVHFRLCFGQTARKRCHVLVSDYRINPYLHTTKRVFYQLFFKTGTLEINSEIIQKNIEKAKAGDQVAFTFLLDFFWNEIYGFMLKRTENETDTEDIAIETFAKAFDKITTYNPEFGFNTWLIAIAKNVHIDMLRKKKSALFLGTIDEENQQAYNVIDSTPSIEDEIIKEQNLARLLQYIKELKPAYQEVIQLRYFQEMTYQEIADQLEEPLNNVKIKLLRAKKLLAEIIQQKK